MPAIIIPRRHLIQPQGRIQLDWHNELTDALVVALCWSDASAREMVRGATPTSGVYPVTGGIGGAGAKFSTGGKWPSAVAVKTSTGNGLGDFTLLSLSAPPTSGKGVMIGQAKAGGDQTYLLANTSSGYGSLSGSVMFGTDTGVGAMAASGAIDGALHCFVGMRGAGAGIIDRDGVQLATGSPSGPAWGATTVFGIETLNGYSGWNNPNTHHFLELAWDRALNTAERVEVGRNPWQLFRADPVRFYSLPNSGTSQDLDASGAATASGTATAAAQVALAGVGVSLAGGTAQTAAAIALSALGLTVASGTATLSSSASGNLAASGAATAGGSASPVATVSISAAGLAQAAAQAGVSAAVLLAGAGAAAAAGNAALAVQLQALAQGAAQASGTATISGSAAGELSAYGQAAASGAALLTLDVRLAAAGSAGASGSGALQEYGAAVNLTAAGFVQAMGAGVLKIDIALAAIGAGRASGAALLVPAGLAYSSARRLAVAAENRRLAVAAENRKLVIA